MRLFRVSGDIQRYGALVLSRATAKQLPLPAALIIGQPLQELWPAAAALQQSVAPGLSVNALGDLAAVGPTGFAASPRARAVLQPALAGVAEFLPARLGDEEWAVVNIINREHALVPEASQRDDSVGGAKVWLRAVFDTTKIRDARAFRDPTYGTAMLTSDVNGSLHELVGMAGLTGLRFALLTEVAQGSRGR